MVEQRLPKIKPVANPVPSVIGPTRKFTTAQRTSPLGFRNSAMKLVSRFCVILAVAMMATGCGGGKPPAGNPPGAAAAPAANPIPVNPAPARIQPQPAPPQHASRGASNAGQDDATAEESEPVPPGPDDFEINSDQIITELAGEVKDPPPEPVEVVALAPGLNSTSLEIVDPANPDSLTAATSVAPGEAAVKSASNSGGGLPSKDTEKRAEAEAPEPTAAGWQLPAGVQVVAGAGTDPDTGLPLRITLERDPVEMVLVPPGVFLEGIDGRDPQAGPQHAVLLEAPYYIDVVEVTVARHDTFREFLRKSEGRRMEPAANHDDNPENPAVGIKFLDAKFYAKWTGKELPTEAQWERAARGDQGFNYPWGNGRPIWHRPRQPGQLDPVATFTGDVSPYGVYDMAGNAREWCLDLYGADIYRKDIAAGGSTVRNPSGPKTFQGAKLQAVRGGKSDWAVWQRAGQSQSEVASDLGFRCVLNIAAVVKDADKSGVKGSDKKKKNAAF